MDLEKLKPWNWFKHEDQTASQIPISQDRAASLPATGSLLNLHRDMDRWFDDAFKSFGLAGGRRPMQDRQQLEAICRPQIDVAGDANSYQISLEVPGMNESDLTLEINHDVLTIKGEKESRSEDKDKQYYRIERSYGSFQRTLALPDDAAAEDISAHLDKGVLRLEIPRRPSSDKEVKRIAINA